MISLPQILIGLVLSSNMILATSSNNSGVTIGSSDIDWPLVRSQPNATGSITFAAPNVSEAFSQYNGDLVDGWTMSIAVRAGNLPTDTMNATAVTGTSISLAGPASLQSENGTVLADSSWTACMSFFGPSAKSPTFKNGSFSDSDCTSALGQDCINDWMDAVNSDTQTGDKCTPVQLPASCDDAAAKSIDLAGESLHANFTGADVMNLATNQIWVGSDQDDATQYGIAVRGVWPVMIRWQGTETNQNGAVSANATLKCIQADDVVAGSTIPSLATRSVGFPATMLVVMMCVGYFI